MADHAGSRKETRERSAAATAAPFVEAKIAVPAVRRAALDRPRLRRLLDQDDTPLVLVAAPAGYGKTTAVRAWCATLDVGLAWVTLDVGDDDPIRLWRYVATAVDRIRPGLGRTALQRLDAPGAGAGDAVDELMNGIGAYGRPLVLVLDDLQTVTSSASMSSLYDALLHLPANARVIVLTRSDPPLGLARLRAGSELVELRATDLAFTADEARELLVSRGRVALGAHEIELLVRRTEGWPAALVLAGLWLQKVEDPAAAVRAFGGEQRFVAEYLSTEVLASLDEEHRSFLYGASVLGELTAALGNHVLGRSDSKELLDELERANYFVLRLERGGWFRVHSLFAEYAEAALLDVDPEAVPRIHRRAAGWLEAQGMPIEAAAHASAAGDHDTVARLLDEYHLPLIRSGGSRTFLRWVRQVPDPYLVRYPELAVAAAVATVLVDGDAAERRRFLSMAENARQEPASRLDPYAEGWALVARSLMLEKGVARAVVDTRRAVDLATGNAEEVISGALASYARALYFAGDLERASAVASRCLEHPEAERRAPSMIHARGTLALVGVELGRLTAARRQAERAKEVATRIGTTRSWLGANASAALGAVLLAEGAPAEAERELAAAEEFFAGDIANVHQAWLLVLLARTRILRGRIEEAGEALGAALQLLDDLPDAGFVPALASEVERELADARARAASGALLDAPSPAEMSVLQLLHTDLSVREIGVELFLSPNTIRSHMRSLYRKLGVHTRADAVARATALGLLGAGPIHTGERADPV